MTEKDPEASACSSSATQETQNIDQGLIKSARLLCTPENFDTRVNEMKEEGAEFITLSACTERDESTMLHYFFQRKGGILVIEVKVKEGATMPSLYSRYQKSDFIEREIYKIFGIKFIGHPNLERLVS